MIAVKWWDHTQPFPESQKTGSPDSDRIREEDWKAGPQVLAESLRKAEEIRYAQTGEKNEVVVKGSEVCSVVLPSA